jgi:hypothetical protein
MRVMRLLADLELMHICIVELSLELLPFPHSILRAGKGTLAQFGKSLLF